jgi:hypothetical protein
MAIVQWYQGVSPEEASMLRAFLLVTPLALLLTGSVEAQQIVIQNRPSAPEQTGDVRVQVNMSFFVPGAVTNSEVSLKAQEDARSALYQSAAKECDLLRTAIASDCRLESVGVNINRNYGQGQNEGFTANGNFGFKVTLK